MKVKIQSVHFTADQKLVEFIEKKMSKLTTFYDHILDTEVILDVEDRGGQVKEKIAKIAINVPGNKFFVKNERKTFEEAIDISVEELKKQLTKHKEKVKDHQAI
jgi:putative sigma-54 modulation protein